MESFFEILQRLGRAFSSRRRLGGQRAIRLSTEVAGAIQIQKVARVYACRQSATKLRAYYLANRAATTIQKLWRGALARTWVASQITSCAYMELTQLYQQQARELKASSITEVLRAGVDSRQAAYRILRRGERILTTAEVVVIQRVARAYVCRRALLSVMRNSGLLVEQRHRRLSWLQAPNRFELIKRKRSVSREVVLSSPPQVIRRVPVGYVPRAAMNDEDAAAVRGRLLVSVRIRAVVAIQRCFRQHLAMRRHMLANEAFRYLSELNVCATKIQRWYRAVLVNRRTYTKKRLQRCGPSVIAQSIQRVQRLQAFAVRLNQREALVKAWQAATSAALMDRNVQ